MTDGSLAIDRPFTIRSTEIADIPQLERVELSAGSIFRETDFAFVADHPPVTPEEHAAAIVIGLHSIAEIAGTAIGFTYGKPIDDAVYIAELCVARPYQRQGIGRALMAAAEDHARAAGAARLTLTTYRDIPWNAPFYRAIGFIEADPLPPQLEKQLRHEADAGHDPTRRYGMVKELV